MTYDELVASVARPSDRMIIAIAGPPAAGKSYLAKQLSDDLNQRGHVAGILEMDGFHYDDHVLSERGLLARKGSPATFDTDGLQHMLQRVKAGGDIAVPVFDRELEISRAAGNILTADTTHIIVEGLYILLDEEPWNALHASYDTTVLLRVSEAVIKSRLEERWKELSLEARATKLKDNDLPNAALVLDRSIDPDIVLTDF